MKIIDKINKALEAKETCFSFEYFPPKTVDGVQNLYERLQRMVLMDPVWIDVTWGAGGSTSDLTLEICETAQNYCGLETMMHLTCTNMPREEIDNALTRAKAAGIQNILALRGDPPRGEEWKQIEGGFANAVDLVKYIRQQYGDYFGICVAGYPEGHVDAVSKEQDIQHLKEKVDAGADFIITQLFYDVDLFLQFVKDCRTLGINVPIVPGIMPIHTYGGFTRMTSLCKTFVPKYIMDELEPFKDNDEEVKKAGVRLCADMCRKLVNGGVPFLHFYTLNLEQSVTHILTDLNLITKEQLYRSLPWSPSKASNRCREDVRPIFWRNRPHSYILRTGSWDEFPNGRWGDYRSPAFGELSDYHLYTPHNKSQDPSLTWGTPSSPQDVYNVFAGFCSGEIKQSPFTEAPMASETDVIKEKLVTINRVGFLTINSQPAVNGAPSTDKRFGWGPRGGYVYQKAYVEFFTSPENVQKIIDITKKKFPTLTFHAINAKGEAYTNTKHTNAVTWGVFPGKEIVQPTVVDSESFVVWKDEAFTVWKSWAHKYATGTPTRTVLDTMIGSYFLVNVVDNNFIDSDIFALFSEVATDPTTPSR